MIDLNSFSNDILAIVNTLNAVDVRGADNMSKMLACIQKLQSMLTISQEAMKNENANHV